MYQPTCRLAGVVIAVVLLISAPAAWQTASKPRLSEAVRAAIDTEGAEAAERRFAEIYPAKKDAYEVDAGGMSELMMEYAQRGDRKASQAVMNIFMKATEASYLGDVPPAPAAATAASSRPAGPVDTGPKRKDLGRFFGVYGNPDRQHDRITPHNFYVNQSCDGYLRLGGLYGGTGGWIMRSESDTVFVQMHVSEFDPVPLRLEFVVGPDGRATAFRHNFYWRKDNPLTRLDDLAPEFADLSWCPEELR